MLKTKLVYINKNQFGYHTDAYMHCMYSKSIFDIVFICFDNGYAKVIRNDIRVIYIKDRSKLLNSVIFMLSCFYYITISKSTVFVQYFPHCDILKRLFFYKKMILDIRSIHISADEKDNQIGNKKIKSAAAYFDHVTVITKEIRDLLKISIEKSTILPLGTNILSSADKTFDKALKMLYIGTLSSRDIDLTIAGLGLFCAENNDINITYHIVGDGCKSDLIKIKNAIKVNHLENKVFLLGRKRHEELQDLWDSCQIGISYVPMTAAYNLQPPTKTYEYLSAGMAVIATKTLENEKMINDTNGVLILDNPQSFYEGLNALILNKKQYNSTIIRESIKPFTWQNIVEEKFINLF